MPPNDQPSDTVDLAATMERYANGDDRAFSHIHRAMAPRLFAFLLRETRNRALAEDLVQQTFLQVHCARARYLPGTDIVPWFFAIARRLLIDSRRRNRPSTSLSTSPDEVRALPRALVNHRSADDELYSKQLESILDRSLQQIPEKHRVAFQLVKLGGLSHSEAADTLGTTSTAVKVRIHRVSRMLLEASPDRARSSAGAPCWSGCA
jgi:RNA polymerase sigma-70 factor, ECF subfamily